MYRNRTISNHCPGNSFDFHLINEMACCFVNKYETEFFIGLQYWNQHTFF